MRDKCKAARCKAAGCEAARCEAARCRLRQASAATRTPTHPIPPPSLEKRHERSQDVARRSLPPSSMKTLCRTDTSRNVAALVSLGTGSQICRLDMPWYWPCL